VTTVPNCQDGIIAELHALRQSLAEKYDHNLDAYSQAAASHCLALGFEFTASPAQAKDNKVIDSSGLNSGQNLA
jgi:hypothetical protein